MNLAKSKRRRLPVQSGSLAAPNRARGDVGYELLKPRRHALVLIDCLEPRRLLSSYVVNTTSDAINPGAGLLSLRAAIAKANASSSASIITFSPTAFTAGTLHTITLTQGQLTLSKTSSSITIAGPGDAVLEINGNEKSRVFLIGKGANATIQGLTIADGAAPIVNELDQGGGILSEGNLTLQGSIVTGNGAMPGANASASVSQGGGICATGPLYVSQCTISSNNATSYGDQVDTAKGGGIYAGSSLTISDSVVSENTATGASNPGYSISGGAADGGGIYAVGSLNVQGTDFDNNTVVGGVSSGPGNIGGDAVGAGIDAIGPLKVGSSDFSTNQAFGGSDQIGENGLAAGGAIASSAAASVTYCELNNDTIQSGNGDRGATASALGGGIESSGTLTVSDTEISGSTVMGGNAIDSYATGGNARGGGIYASGPLTVTYCEIGGNSIYGGNASIAPFAGGAGEGSGIYASNTATIIDTSLVLNLAVGGQGGDANINTGDGGNGGAAAGAGLYSVDSLKLFDSTITGNHLTASVGGSGYNDGMGDIRYAGKPGATMGAGLTVSGSCVSDNSIISADVIDSSTFNDVSGSLGTASANNLIGVGGGLTNGAHGNKVGINNPELSGPGYYGGPYESFLPMTGSPAIDAGSNSLIPAGVTADERGYPRILDKTVDIGAVECNTVTVSGSVFNDTNGDGIRQASELGLAGWQVYADIGDSGHYVSGDPVATSGSTGKYSLSFTVTDTNPVIIREVMQAKYRQTNPAGISTPGYTLSPAKSTIYSNENFGDSLKGLVIGVVFHDVNGNGKLDTGDAGLAGWTIEADYLIGSVWHDNDFSTTTDGNGNYSFVFAAGSYRIHEVIKGGYTLTSPAVAGYSLTLASGATDAAENFGGQIDAPQPETNQTSQIRIAINTRKNQEL